MNIKTITQRVYRNDDSQWPQVIIMADGRFRVETDWYILCLTRKDALAAIELLSKAIEDFDANADETSPPNE